MTRALTGFLCLLLLTTFVFVGCTPADDPVDPMDPAVDPADPGDEDPALPTDPIDLDEELDPVPVVPGEDVIPPLGIDPFPIEGDSVTSGDVPLPLDLDILPLDAGVTSGDVIPPLPLDIEPAGVTANP